MIIIDLMLSPDFFLDMGIDTPHVGLLYVLGLLFGPYGAFGAVLANIVLDLISGFTPLEILPSAIFTFGVSYLAYKLWYTGIKPDEVKKPTLDNIYHLLLFLGSINLCGIIYSAVHGALIGFIVGPNIDQYVFATYLLNFINISFIFGILAIWLSKKIDLTVTPEISKRPVNKKLYQILIYSLVIVTISLIISIIIGIDGTIISGEIILIGILLFGYLTKPFKGNIKPDNNNTIIEKIIRNFLIITLTIAIFGMVISILGYNFVTHLDTNNIYLMLMPSLLVTDIIIILFFIPGIIILKYVEDKVIKPITSFSEIEGFIHQNEKIEAEGLLDVYSKYINEKNEIGTLARSYSELINHNNNYIENIHQIEGEKERINAELDIARKIQASALPTEALENDDFIINGYSHPAKEVGGDFFDYYMIDDDNLAIVIGDASGKGVPAALIAMITQVIIKQILEHETNPSKVLYLLNNQLSQSNATSMFLTLWLGIYNRTTKKLAFSNAGHNSPIIKENGEFKYLYIDSGLVLGIMEDFEYVSEEINLTEELILYTDGITDANNEDYEMYGEGRLLKFFNEFESYEDPITPLLDDIHDFTKDADQYDDMTLVYLRIK